MKQTIFDDPYGLRAWDTNTMSRCFVHLCNSLTWQGVTGQSPPHPPMTSADYERRGLPWFEHYDDGDAVGSTEELSKLSSITQIAQEKQTNPLPENESLHPTTVIAVGPTSQAVREGNF